MTWTPVSGIGPQYSTNDNDLASDYWLKFYQSGTSTPFSAAIDSTGAIKLAKIKLNSSGYPISNIADETSVFIPHVDQDYRVVLFKSEADADSNNTANAAFNIDGLQPQIAPLASSADVALRDITVLIQDDYDRSAKFIDGRDFTAGAGPHVITVPAEWTPSNSDVRFYKVDSSGIITTITPSSRDATTFTVPITLLSTDILFLGDDRFRDQNASDPEFIRDKLDVPSNTEALLDVANSVSESNLSANSVTTDKVANLAITGFKIADDTISAVKLRSASVTTDKIAGFNITEEKYATDSVSVRANALYPSAKNYTAGNAFRISHKMRTAVSNGTGFIDTGCYVECKYDGQISFFGNASTDPISNDSKVRILKNGSVYQTITINTSSTDISETVNVSAGDFVMIQVGDDNNNATCTLNATGGPAGETGFYITRVS